jgi:hypothetical protein
MGVVFKCQACGNLHGAQVRNCGICGSAAVVLVPEEEAERAKTDAPPDGIPKMDPVLVDLSERLATLFERMERRAAAQQSRDDALAERAEDDARAAYERAEALNQAQISALAALEALAIAATVELKRRAAPDAPRVE